MKNQWWRSGHLSRRELRGRRGGVRLCGALAQIMRTSRGDAAREEAGTAALEFAIVAPVLLMILLGIVQFGVTINNYLELTGGVGAGGRAFAIGRSSATPRTTATAMIASSAPNLTATNMVFTLQVNGAACATDAACQTALTAAVGGSASVSASYPCNLTIMGVNYAPNCTLTAKATDLIE